MVTEAEGLAANSATQISPPKDEENTARFAALLAHIERRRGDKQYFDSWKEEVAEYRREAQEQLERELAEEGK